MDKLEVSPQSVRGYGNIIIPKLSTDFVGKYNEIYTDSDGYFVLSYGGVMLKASATVSNTIKGIQASLTVLVSTRDSDTPVSGLSVNCSVDDTALTSQTTDSTGKCTFTWTPSDLGDSSLLISISPQDDYAGLSLDKTVTVGLLLGFDGIMTSLSLEDDEVYTGTFEEDVEDRSQLSEFVKDVWVASGGEPIVDEYGIIHICEPGDLVVESEGLEQLPEYSNVLFEEDVDLLTGAVYDMSISEDYEIVLDCLERSDIVPDVPPTPPSYDGITLTSDKNILSYADSDTCTLTAQLTDDGSPASVDGVSVEFFNGSTSLGTATTNSSGVATKVYLSSGAGDVSLTASVDSYTSTAVTIEDLLLYRASVTSSDSFNVSLPSHFEITSTVTKNASSGAYCYYMMDNFDAGSLRQNGSISVRKGSTTPFADNNTSIIQLNTPTTLKYEYDNGSHTISANGQSATGNNSDALGNFKSMTVTHYTVVDLKVKPLPAPTYDGISLSADKSVLSYSDGESATLTAQLTDSGSPVSRSGVTVEFFNGSTSLGTADTNSSGVATKSYASAGSGDVSFTAEVDSIISSEIYVEDCIDYQPLTSNATASRWTIPTGVTSTYDSNGWKLTANAYKQVKLTDKLTSDCSVEFTLVDYTNVNDPSVIIYAYTNGETTPNQVILTGGSSNSSNRKVLNTLLDRELVKGAVYRIDYTSSTLKVYEDSVLLGSASNGVGLPTRFEWHIGANSRYAIYKDLKVKPL